MGDAERKELGDPVLIPVIKISENDWNPNIMPPAKFEALKRGITELGFVYPIVVRKTKKGYEIEDGAHRFRAYQEVFPNKKSIPAFVIDDDDKVARIRTLALNNVRGKEDMLALAKVIGDLHSKFSMDMATIEELTGYSAKKMESMIVDSDPVMPEEDDDIEEPEMEEEAAPVEMTFIVSSSEEAEIVTTAIEEAVLNAPEEMRSSELRGWSLVEICRAYSKSKRKAAKEK